MTRARIRQTEGKYEQKSYAISEDQLADTRKLLGLVIERLEQNLGEDLDEDGKVGS
jgi:hypothetical protein